MSPIRFSCTEVLPTPASAIVDQILDIEQWTSFTGYGPIPAIRSTKLLHRAPEVIGTRFEVTNADGSRHVEEVVHFIPERELTMRMGSFSRPLDGLATHFLEHWRFEPEGEGTRVVRSFELHPKSAFAYPIVWLIGRLLSRATARHLAWMRTEGDQPRPRARLS